MPWNTLKPEDVQSEILPDELAVLTLIQGADSILGTILGNCLAEIQARILVGGNQIGQPGTIPDQIRSDAIAYIRWRWFSSLPNTLLQSDQRRKQYETALERFDAIGQGKERVEIPSNPQNVASPANRAQVVRTRSHGWDKLGET